MTDYHEPDQRAWSDPGPDGSTPLDPDEVDGLIPSWVATRGDLNTAEQANIVQALSLIRWQGRSVEQLLDDLVARQLHKDMFRDVWEWAGTYRLTERNIGVDPVTISVCVRDLMEDAKAWIGGQAPMEPDVVGFRFHHRLVQVHAFPNGNGRHARAMTDLLLRAMGQPPFSWGRTGLETPSATRSNYIAALRAADDRRFDLLARFVRS
jgi:Fic-DOC domain mobile mystery protein B